MTLIKSISGIRGTIGDTPGDALTPFDIVKFVSAYAVWLKSRESKEKYNVIVGRDARISGEMVNMIVGGTLLGMGINVTDLGLASTPTVEMAVKFEEADGGIIITASHNPVQWNALKLLNHHGEFLSESDGIELLKIAENEKIEYSEVFKLGSYKKNKTFELKHINAILELPLVDIEAIRKRGFKVAVDCVNSVGGSIVPKLLNELGVKEIVKLNCEPTGRFTHNPEPLPENLSELSELVSETNSDIGFALDPDVDRLAIICEDGSFFGEEYTLVAASDYVLTNFPGNNTVSNLSSTMALRDITEKYGGTYNSSAVGEVNVTRQMKLTSAIIGGEGNGGVIYPELHYGRDALVGIALILSHIARSGVKCSELRKRYPNYHISKNKIELKTDTDLDSLFISIKEQYSDFKIDETDGLKINMNNGWIHIRKSNTEPIIRIYSESTSAKQAELLFNNLKEFITTLK